MDNIPLPGGMVVGAPEGWDAEKRGHCLSISVQRVPIPEAAGWYEQTTGWRFGREELETLAGGGAFMLRLRLPIVPVMQLWVEHPDGTVVGDLTSTTERDAAFRAAIIQIASAMALARGDTRDKAAWMAMETPDILAAMMEMAQQSGHDAAAGLVRHLPVTTLDAIARGEAPALWGNSARADRETERRITDWLGVEMNPSPLRPVDQPDAAPPPVTVDALFDQLAVALHALSVPLAFESGELVDAYQRVTGVVDQIEAERRKPYRVGERTMDAVFKPAGLTDMADTQALLDAIEAALIDGAAIEDALADFVPEVPRVAERPTYADDFVVSVDVPVGKLRAARILLGDRVRQAGDINGTGDGV